MMRWFWEQFWAGVTQALSNNNINEPFGGWACPPLPEPPRWPKHSPIPSADEEDENQ